MHPKELDSNERLSNQSLQDISSEWKNFTEVSVIVQHHYTYHPVNDPLETSIATSKIWRIEMP